MSKTGPKGGGGRKSGTKAAPARKTAAAAAAAGKRGAAGAADDRGSPPPVSTETEGLLQSLPEGLRDIAHQTLKKMSQEAELNELRVAIEDWSASRTGEARTSINDDRELKQALDSLRLRGELRAVGDPRARAALLGDLAVWLRDRSAGPSGGEPPGNAELLEFLTNWRHTRR